MSMTPERIEEIKAMLAAATPGPWESKNESVYSDDLLDPVCQLYGNSEMDFDNALGNGSFIAASILVIPELLAALEELQQQLEASNQTIDEKNEHIEQLKESIDIKNADLAEEQQTIARQQKVIDWYESGGSMGELVEEGSDKA